MAPKKRKSSTEGGSKRRLTDISDPVQPGLYNQPGPSSAPQLAMPHESRSEYEKKLTMLEPSSAYQQKTSAEGSSVSEIFGVRTTVYSGELSSVQISDLVRVELSDFEETEDEEEEPDNTGAVDDTQEPMENDLGQFSDLFFVEPVSPSPQSVGIPATRPPSSTQPTSPDPMASPPVPDLRSPSTNWQDTPISPPNIPFTGSPGLKVKMDQQEPWDFFKLLFTDDFINNIVEKTNANAEIIFLESESPQSRITRWKPLTLGEFYVFLGLFFHMGNVVMSQIRDYWKTDRLYHFPFFGQAMSRDRFELILRCLYFNSRPSPDDEPPVDRLYKLRPVLDQFNDRMNILYYPHRELIVDESMVLWRGRLVFRQYIKSKRHKYGVKFYILAEKSGLVHRIIIYTGSADSVLSPAQSHAQCVVDRLVAHLSGKGHSLFMGNYFTSLATVTNLLNGDFYCTGTLQGRRKGNPQEVVSAKLKRGDTIQRWNEHGICIMKWKDKRDVMMISSEFAGDIEDTHNRSGQTLLKPKSVVEYNKYMGGVDRLDQLISYNMTSRKTISWYKKIAFHILQQMLNNVYIFYKACPGGKYKTTKEFRGIIIENLVDEGHRLMNIVTPRIPRLLAESPVQTLHYPQLLPYKSGSSGKRKQKDCRVCKTKNSRIMTNIICPDCPGEPGLCIDPCFRDYHVQ